MKGSKASFHQHKAVGPRSLNADKSPTDLLARLRRRTPLCRSTRTKSQAFKGLLRLRRTYLSKAPPSRVNVCMTQSSIHGRLGLPRRKTFNDTRKR